MKSKSLKNQSDIDLVSVLKKQLGPTYRIFDALERVIDIVEKEENSRELISELRLTFQLMNAEKKDKRFAKQLLHVLEKIAEKRPVLANAIKDLEIEALKYRKFVNFYLLAEYGLFCRNRRNKKDVKNLFNSKRMEEVLKRGKLANSYLENEHLY